MTEPVLCENLSKKLQPKQKEFYESLIQRCDSDDPLGDWYEYLTWAEENYLKDKREYTQLLQRCLVKFRHEKQYHQDTRYVALWVKQIKSSSRSLELFKKCLESGIGKHNALMYIAWSHDLEINKDVKGAHRILKEALNCNAQPKVLLEKAQQNFIIRMGRSMFEAIDLESVKAEQMMMVEQLLLYENKINVGKKINHASSGVLQPMSPNTNHQSNVSASPLIIFNEEDKENPKPGIWTGTTGQQLHKELKAKYICNPYKAKSKPVDDFSCALAMFEPVDPTKRVMYCKSKVYTEFSFEELRAITYLKGYRRPRRKRDNEQVESENMHEDCNGMETARQELDSPNCPVAMFEPPGPTHFMCTSKVFANGLECSVEELRAKKYLKDNMPRTCNKILDVKPEDVESVPANKGIFHKPQIFDLLLNEPDISLSIKDTKNKEDAQSNESQDLASLSALCSNSITCNTREAINVVQNCWSSADDCQCLGIPAKKNNLLNNRYESPDSVKKAVPFEVYVDEKAHCNLVKNNVPFEVFEDVTGQLEVPDLKKKNVPFEVFEDVTGQLELPDSKEKDVPFEVLNEKENFQFEVLEDGTDYLEQKKAVQPIKHIEPHAFTTSSNEEANRAINSITDHNQIKMKDELNVFEIEGVIPVEDENDSNGFGYLLKKLLGSENQNSKQENVRISDGSSLGSAAVGIDGFLPYVPSPGLTEEEELALKGTETKENKPPNDFVPPPSENRVMMGVLQPTDRFPSNPLDDPALQQDVPEDKDYTSCTTAFSYPLVSSTPFTDHLKPVCLSSETDAREEENNLHLNALSRTNEAVAYVNPVSNLSKIESTFEEYRISSGGSNASTSKSYSVESSGTMTQTTYAEQKKVIGSRSNSEMNESGRGMRFMYTNPQMKVLQDGLVEQNCVSVKYVEHKSESEAVTNKSSVHIVNCSKELELMQKQPQPHSLDNEIEIDPFDANVNQKLLNNTDFSSGISPDRLKILDVPVPRFRIGDTVSLECDKFKIDRVLGEGNYAKVFKGIDLTSEKIVALKMQKPSWIWEFYICEQIRKRLNDPLRGLAFMNIERAYIFNNGSVMLTDFAQMGSLLNLINIVKQERTRFPEALMLCWMVELLNIAEGLQSCKIIHGDIKPDNIVVRMIPKSGCAEPTLQLIDMGRGIDMTLFPDGTTFNRIVSTQAFQCVEMQTKRPWTYQTDLYGIAACMYCMIFLDYMKVVQKNKKWVILRMVPRYNKFKSILEWFFHTLLNIESCERMPDLLDLKQLAAKEMRGAVQRNPNSCANFLQRFHLIK